MVRRAGLAVLMACGMAMASGLAVAQQPKAGVAPKTPTTAVAAPAAPLAPTGPVSPDPSTTSASYGDWLLRCQRVGEGDKAQRLCEVSQTIKQQNAQEPIAEVAIGHLPTDHTLHLTVVLPASVSFPSTVLFATSDKPPDSVELPWRRCIPGGCFADAMPSDDNVRAWRAQTDNGRISFKDAAGRDINVPVSFRGLAQALDALAKS